MELLADLVLPAALEPDWLWSTRELKMVKGLANVYYNKLDKRCKHYIRMMQVR